MPRSAKKTLGQSDLEKEKENNHGSGMGAQRERSGRQRQPTEKISTARAEQAAAAEQRELTQARKAQRARRAQQNNEDDDGNDDEGDVAKSVASSNFKTHTVASKSVTVKTKALAKRDNLPARVQGAFTREAQTKVKTRTVATKPAEEDTPDEDEPDDDQPDEDEDDQEGDEDDQEGDEDDQEGDEDANRGRSPELDEHESQSTASQSTANVAGLKRRRSSAVSLVETKTPRTSNGGRPKAADYDDTLKAVILSAISCYRANLSSVCAFPDIATEAEMLTQVWKITCTHLETTVFLTPQIAKLITNRGSQLRGELKSKTRPLVEGSFGFESGQNRKTVATNRHIAENLKEGKGFVYKALETDTEERKGMYQAKIIQKVVNVMWFRNKQDEGILHEANFKPLSVEALALVLAAIECCIDEWISGVRSDIPFSTALYKDVYEDHIRCLERFDKITKQMILPNILLKLYNRGRFHAGALPISRASVPTIDDSAFQAALKEYEEDSHTETDGENGDSD